MKTEQRLFITCTQLKNRGPINMSQKQNSNRFNGIFKKSQIQEYLSKKKAEACGYVFYYTEFIRTTRKYSENVKTIL